MKDETQLSVRIIGEVVAKTHHSSNDLNIKTALS